MSKSLELKKISRSFAIVNIHSGWALVPFGTRQALSRGEDGRFTGLVEEQFVLPAIMFRVPQGGTLKQACEKLAHLVRNADSVAIYLQCRKAFVTEPVRAALGDREVVDVTYIPQQDIESAGTVMGLAFRLAHLAAHSQACPEGLKAYAHTESEYVMNELAPSRTEPCARCKGEGYLHAYAHIMGGECFVCHGSGSVKVKEAA